MLVTYLHSYPALITPINLRSSCHSKYLNVNFPAVKEKDVCLTDVNILVYNIFKRFILEPYKIGLIKSLLFWCFSLCSDFIKFCREIDKLRRILYKNRYSRELVDKFC